ncbi:hypothetical protein O6V28_01220, partial [Salmonella enterica subsp. enterica]
MPAFEWVHVQLHQQKGMISLSPPTICNSAILRAAGCEIIRAEKASGSGRTGRSELQLLLEFLRPGDTLMVT